MRDKKNILFVCMGNICRSPALAAALMHVAGDRAFVDSAGLTAYYLGHPVEERMRIAMQKKGIDPVHRSKLFHPDDFARFDYIFAVSREVQEQLVGLARSPEERKKVHLATDFALKFKGQDILDPYAEDVAAFDRAAEIALDAAQGIAKTLL